jgi:sulfur carrier protein
MIAVVVNGSSTQVESGATVAALVGRLDADARGVAVAVNEAVVPRSAWAATALQPGDRVEVLRAAQGGC